jgi:hypothetical protein
MYFVIVTTFNTRYRLICGLRGTKENKEYDNFAELVQNNKRKSVSTMGIYVPEKLDTGNMQKCVNRSVQDQELVGKDQDSCDNRPLEKLPVVCAGKTYICSLDVIEAGDGVPVLEELL